MSKQRLSARLSAAVRSALSIEGLVGTLIGAGVLGIAGGLLAQLADFRVGPAFAIGAGVGALAVATYIWRVVLPRRELQRRAAAAALAKTRQALRQLAEEGMTHVGVSLAPGGGETTRNWQRRVHAYLSEALGLEAAKRVIGRESWDVRGQVRRLWELVDELAPRAKR